MKKKVVSILLVAVMAGSLLAGCGSSKNSVSVGSDNSSAEEEAAETDADSGDEYSTEIDMDEEPYTVAIQVVTLPGSDASDSLEAREEAINAITVPAINCKVEIQEIWISELINTTSLGIAGDQKLDIISVGSVQTLSSMTGSEMLLDMNESNLIQNRGKTLEKIFADTLASGEVNGQQLAVPAKVYTATQRGFYYNKTIADAAGVTLGDYVTLDDLEEALIKIHEYDPDIYPYYTGDVSYDSLSSYYDYEHFDSSSIYGVILDAENDPAIENLYATDLFKDFSLRMERWTEMGLQPGDLTDTTTRQDYFQAQKLFCLLCNVDPGVDGELYTDDFEVASACFSEPYISNSNVTEYMWGISVNSERPDKAMDFLNFLYENEDVANILEYGLEGVNYDYVDSSDIIIKTNGTYDTTFYHGGNTENMLIEYPNDEDYPDKLQTLEDEAAISPILGYMFDDSDYQTESAVLTSTLEQYMSQLMNGTAGSEEAVLEMIDELNAGLEAAGINDVIAGNQAQLDEFLASN